GWSSFEAALLAAGEWSGELKQKTKDGRYIDVESRLKLIADRAGGRLILEVIGMGFDWQCARVWLGDKAKQRLECAAAWRHPAAPFGDRAAPAPRERGAGVAGQVWAEEKVRWVPDRERAAPEAALPAGEPWRAALVFPIQM